MQLYFIRHGQSANNLLYATTGSDEGRDCDPELTKIGRQQAFLLADYLISSAVDLTHLYSSLMVRAVSTGMIVAERTGLALTAWPDLHEEGGIYLSDDQGNRIGQPGKNRAYFEECFPRLILPDTMNPSGWWNRPFETVESRSIRARRFLNDFLKRHGGTDHRVAVISHGGFYNQFMNALLDLPSRQKIWFSLNNTAITKLDFTSDPEGINFVYQNLSNFLPTELVT